MRGALRMRLAQIFVRAFLSYWKWSLALFSRKRRHGLPSVVILTGPGKGAPAPPYRPRGVEVIQDTSEARWIEERLWPSGRAASFEGFRLGCLLPGGFAAYARVLHPAEVRTDQGYEPVRWSTVASWTGRAVHRQMQFELIADLVERKPYRYEAPPWGNGPQQGTFPSFECHAAAEVLREFTSTPGNCYFCVWEGFGFIDPEFYKRTSRVKIPGRSYLLFRGPLDAIGSFIEPAFHGYSQSPNIWWPEDRAWCVATEIDSMDTYIGGSEECIQRILARPDLETFPATIEARIDFGADIINL